MLKTDNFPIRSAMDVVLVRQVVRAWAIEQAFGLIDQTKLITAASELARNALQHGGGGEMHIEAINDGGRRGVRLTFLDKGPGIADVSLALRDGFTTGGGLGMGLPGARRLVNEFEIASQIGQGTTVTITKWK